MGAGLRYNLVMETIIKSTKNSLIKDLKRLNTAKERHLTGRFLVDGLKCIDEALGVDQLCEMMLVEESNEALFDDLSSRFNGTIIKVSEEALSAVSAVKTPQPAVAVCSRNFLNQHHKSGLIIALDGIADPGNMGAIIRTADAVGAAAVYSFNHCVDFLSPKAIRASMGSVFHIPVIESVIADITAMKAGGYRVLGADLAGTTEFICGEEKICLVIGSEAHGISDAMAEVIDKKIKIPIYGKAESLNAAVAASILMYKLRGY